MSNLPVPVYRTFTVSEVETGAFFNAGVRDAGNFVTNPPIAVLYQVTAQTLTTVSAISLDGSTEDSYGGHSISTNNSRYTAVVTGWYWVKGEVMFTTNTTGSRSAQLYKNGAAIPTTFTLADGGSTFYAAQGVEAASLVYLTAGDYVEVYGGQNTGSGLPTYVGTAASNLQIWWAHV